MFLRPGQGFQRFKIFRKASGTTSTGRPISGDLALIGEVLGMLTNATPKEVENWKQANHPITHKIIQRGAEGGRADDVLMLDGRYFKVKGTRNPGELGHCLVYYAEERNDLNAQGI